VIWEVDYNKSDCSTFVWCVWSYWRFMVVLVQRHLLAVQLSA